jgi:mono/diheme cytochrome c family protein
MQSTKSSVVAILFSTAVLFGSVTLTSAAPQKKKPVKKAPVAAAPSKELVAAGKKVYDAGGCGACHAIGEKGGKTGPELTHIGKDPKWPAAKIEAIVRNPKKAANTDKMPAYPADKISDKEMKSLLAYLSVQK